MKNGQPESLAEALLLIEKQKKSISEQEEKILAQQVEIGKCQHRCRINIIIMQTLSMPKIDFLKSVPTVF